MPLISPLMPVPHSQTYLTFAKAQVTSDCTVLKLCGRDSCLVLSKIFDGDKGFQYFS